MGESMRKGSSKSFQLKIHLSYYFVALGFILTGHFLNFFVFSLLIFVHELGHFFMAMLLKIRVKKIVIYPFGGITFMDHFINVEIFRELFVAIAGVMVQYVFYFIICILFHFGFIRNYTFNLFQIYHFSIVFFNLLPIYPLDGGKIFYLLFCKFLPYRIANYLIVFVSFFLIFFMICLQIYVMNYSNFMIYGVLIYYIFIFFKRIRLLYYRFLMERYLYSFSFSDVMFLHDYRYMYRDKKHYFVMDDDIWDEKKYLSYLFQRRK